MSERGARGRGRTGPVTAEAVIGAALVVIDEEGLDALTMRRLAHDLGVEPVTIYRQLPNKDAILAGVAKKLWREMAPPGAGPAAGDGGAADAPAAGDGGAANAPAAGDGGAANAPAAIDDGAPDTPAPAPDAGNWREQVRGMWLALNGLMQRHPNAIPIIARGGTYSPSAGEGTAGMLRLFKDAGLTPGEAAELLHILSACVVGFGFASLWVRQIAAAQRAPATNGGEPAPTAADAAAGAAPETAGDDDLADYLEATAKWDPAQFAAALDIVLGAYGDDSGR